MWSLIVDSLFRVPYGMGIKAVGYADDITVLARGVYEEVRRNFVQEAPKVIEA